MANFTAPPRTRNTASLLTKYYLVAYNVLSALGWAYVLAVTFVHVLNLDGGSDTIVSANATTASSTLSRFLSTFAVLRSLSISTSLEARLPLFFQPIYRRCTTTFARVGTQTAFVQSFAILEVLHVLFGLVRSPIQTTAMQVSSRLFLVWGIVEQFPLVHSNPLYASMVLAWSMTEVIRYCFYATNLAGYNPSSLLYLRYTTFYVLYPVGASSEAFLIYSTLPTSSPIPGWQSWLRGMWKPTDYLRGVLFAIWWPGLYIMYTYMIAQRRKVLNDAPGKSKSLKVN